MPTGRTRHTRGRVSWTLEAAVLLVACEGSAAWLGVTPATSIALVGAVTVIGAQHGLLAGVFTGLAAGALSLQSVGALGPEVLDLTADRSSLWPAFALVLLGALAGLVGEGHRRRTRRLAAELDVADEEAVNLERRLTAVLSEREALDRQFARSVLPVEALLQEAESLEGLERDEAAGLALVLLARSIGARQAGFYMLEGQDLVLTARLGMLDAPSRRPAFDDPIARAIANGCSHAVRSSAELRAASAWLVAPVPRADGGCHGALAVHDLPFTRLTNASVTALDELARRLGQALDRQPAARPVRKPLLALPRPARPVLDGALPEAG